MGPKILKRSTTTSDQSLSPGFVRNTFLSMCQASNRTEYAHGLPLAADQEDVHRTAPMSRAQVVSFLGEEVLRVEDKIGDMNRSLPDAEIEKNVDIHEKRIQGLVKFLRNVKEDIVKLSEWI